MYSRSTNEQAQFASFQGRWNELQGQECRWNAVEKLMLKGSDLL
jgi:hypothetical protein